MKLMRIDFTETNLYDGVPNSFAYCDCCGQDPKCPTCGGTGHIFVPFVCLFNCKEGFDSLGELSVHMQVKHGAFPLTEQ